MAPRRSRKSTIDDLRQPSIESGSLLPDHEAALGVSPVASVQPIFTLQEFVENAWKILEPVTPLRWNWHLDLICDYLTLVKADGRPIGTGKPGPITTRMISRFREITRETGTPIYA